MEFTLMLLGIVGAWLVWTPSPPDRAHAKQTVVSQTSVRVTPVQESASDQKAREDCYWRIEHWPRLIVVSAMLTVGAILVLWSTEVLYTQQVIYSHDSQIADSKVSSQAAQAPGTGAPNGLSNYSGY